MQRKFNRQSSRGVATHATFASTEQAIVRHVTRLVAPPAFVVHEINSDSVHIDVHVVPPSKDRAFWFLFTTGMSASPMTKPRDACGSRFAELAILLPPYWKVDRASWESDSRWFWPIRELRSAAQIPKRHSTWLGWGHTITSDSGRFDASTALTAMIVVDPVSVPPALASIPTSRGGVDLFALCPLYPEELDYRLRHGTGALVDALEAAGTSDVIDPQRPVATSVDAGSAAAAFH